MLDSLKRTLLASLGAVAFTREKLKSTIDEFVSRGELTRDQGKAVFETLVRRGEEESEEISTRILAESRSFRDLFPVTRLEFQKLVERVERIEKRVDLPAGAETLPGGGGPPPGPPHEFPGEALPPRE